MYYICLKYKNHSIMKKLLLSLLFISGLSSNAQVTVFEDSFETYTNFAITGFGGWQTIDVDLLTTYGVGTGISWLNNGAPQAFMVYNPSATTPPVTNTYFVIVVKPIRAEQEMVIIPIPPDFGGLF